MTTLKLQAAKERAIRELEKRYEKERQSLYEFVKTYWEKEKRETLDTNRHIEEICNKLEKVYTGEIKRLIINIPPRSLKTELVSKAFPIWCLGHENNLKFIEISYSAGLAEQNSGGARDMYQSQTYRSIFPRVSKLKESQNTKQHWRTEEDGQMFASGSQGTITGFGCDIMIIDDPINPEESNSDLLLRKVNRNYQDTLKSRLNDKREGAIVIIMQRLHDNDLCGYLMEAEAKGTGEKREKLIIPAIAEVDDEIRKRGESFFETRFPIDILHTIQKDNPIGFSTQYQQNPVNKESQEFHEERFQYYTEQPKGRIFTTCDPAFTKSQQADFTAIVTGCFVQDKLYILEYTHGKFDPAEMIDKLIYHHQKRNPEKIGIEAFQAQNMIGFNLRLELERRGKYVQIEDIKQTGDKETKLRKLIPLYRNGLIFHKVEMSELENELIRFPRGRHDDIIDAVQMLYDMYTLTPNTGVRKQSIKIEYDDMGRPIGVQTSDQDLLFN